MSTPQAEIRILKWKVRRKKNLPCTMHNMQPRTPRPTANSELVQLTFALKSRGRFLLEIDLKNQAECPLRILALLQGLSARRT